MSKLLEDPKVVALIEKGQKTTTKEAVATIKDQAKTAAESYKALGNKDAAKAIAGFAKDLVDSLKG